jgi:ribosome biogenesis GTPase
MAEEDKLYRIVRGVGGNYWVHGEDLEEIQVQAPGIFRKDNNKPYVGDLVTCEETSDDLIPLRMTKILPRKNLLPRPPIVNIDRLWLVIPLLDPDPDLWVLDKMLVLAHYSAIPLRLIFTKEDLASDEHLDLAELYKRIGYDVSLSRPGKEDLLKLLRQELSGHLICLAGPSGAGKSTLLNSLMGQEIMETQEISDKLGRGKHTTRHVELFPFEGGYLADTPGFSSLDLGQAGVEEEDLVRAYPEIWARQNDCRFLSCKHLTEPSCAVKADPTIDPGRLARYQEFRRQLENYRSYAKNPRR